MDCEYFKYSKTIRTAWSRLVAKIHIVWHTLQVVMNYYSSMRVIFHMELALIMLCIVDLSINFTALVILIVVNWTKSTKAEKNTVWTIRDNSYMHKHFWDELFTITQALYLAESTNRIYYCLKLAYHHDKKVKQGELCCMKCHQPLMAASVSPVLALPHLISAVASIVYFTVAYKSTAIETMEYHKKYFANSPFVNKANSSSAMETSMYYAMAKRVLANDLAVCRLNRNASMESSVRSLLNTAKIDYVVDYKCAVSSVHCNNARFYLQLTIESIFALLNYTVISTLFSHVIKMHKYEVYNQQTRLQARGGSRTIRVYKLRRSGKTDARLSASEVRAPQQEPETMLHVTPTTTPINDRLLDTVGYRESDYRTWMERTGSLVLNSTATAPNEAVAPAEAERVPTQQQQTQPKEATEISEAQQQPQHGSPAEKVFNCRDLVDAKKVVTFQDCMANVGPSSDADSTGHAAAAMTVLQLEHRKLSHK